MGHGLRNVVAPEHTRYGEDEGPALQGHETGDVPGESRAARPYRHMQVFALGDRGTTAALVSNFPSSSARPP